MSRGDLADFPGDSRDERDPKDEAGSAQPTSRTGPTDEQVDALFCEILDLPRERWAARLEEVRDTDPGLYREVSALLEGADRTDPLLRQGGAAAPGILNDFQQQAAVLPGAELGRYRILEEVSRGGMGIVYRAERADGQFDQQVALKVMAAAGEAALDQFGRERQILADLKHPNIAHLIDGGVTPAGQPYLVMDFVDGIPIDQYCEQQRLGLRQRLRLLMEVCAAVEAAHRQLIVHRDLKPSNILVTEEEQVKLLDFGIAKLLDEERAASTLTVARFLTPQYASPEQIRGEVITVASDVYQLGLIAYELITGRRPYEIEGLSAAEAERKVFHEAPTQPSSAATAAREEAETWTGPDVDEITGDLDTIVLKAIHKEPERRYGSVEQLREDLSRFLEGLPILARPDTLSYRLQKFVGRNRWAVAATSAALLIVAGLVSAFTWGLARERDQTRLAAEQAEEQRARAEEKRAETEEVLSFLTGLFEASDPYGGEIPQKDLTARQLLDRGTDQLETSFGDRPLIQARLLQTTGRIYSRIELFEKSEALLRKALDIRESADAGDHRQEIAENLTDLGYVLIESAQMEGAEATFRRSYALLLEALGPDHPRVADAAIDLANLFHRLGRYEERERLLRQALAIYDAQEIAESDRSGLALLHLGYLLTEKGDVEAAEALLRRSLEISRATGDSESVRVANACKILGLNLEVQGRHREAQPLFEEALRIHELRAGPDSIQASNLIQNLAVTHYSLGDLDTAESLIRRAVSITEAKQSPKSADALALRHNLATIRHERGDAAGAEREFRRLRRIQKEVFSPTHKLNALTEIELARTLITQSRNREALSLLRNSRDFLDETFGSKAQYLHICLFHLGRAHRALGELDDAEASYRRALELRRERMPADSKEVAEVAGELVALLRQTGRSAEAEALELELKAPSAGAE